MNAKGNKMLMTSFLPSYQNSLDTTSRHVVASKSERLAHGRRGEPRFTSWVAIRAAISALRAAPEGDSGTRPDVPAPRRVTGSKASG